MVSLYNTLNRKIIEIQPTNKKVTMYVCGVTPYDTTHLGHAFTYVIFDTLIRLLEHRGFAVHYVQNVTDVDDPLFERARKIGTTWQEIADTWTKRFQEDMQYLHVTPPREMPKVSGEIPPIIDFIKEIFAHSYAYEYEGTVYFDTQKLPQYGQLCKLPEQEMIAISRERGNDPDDPHKKHPLDFVLWKPSATDEPAWPSPWGNGRPGWHIECSSMGKRYLGNSITIHGGGSDLIFPHHEGERAQNIAATGSEIVDLWMHTAMVYYQGEKMSKSLGNLILVRDLENEYSALEIRWYLLSHHYQQDWEFFEKDMVQVKKFVEPLTKALGQPGNQEPSTHVDSKLTHMLEQLENNFRTDNALEDLHDMATEVLKSNNGYNTLQTAAAIMGFR